MADVELAALPPPVNDLSPPAAAPPDEGGRGDDDEDEDEAWSSPFDHLGILLCFVGGIGQVLRFPYYFYIYGGGAFLLAHLLLLVLFGIPLLLLESFVGQFTSSSSIAVYSSYPAFKGIGIATCLVMALTAPCIAVSIGYALLYLVYSFSYVHRWGFCDNAWNTGLCVDMVTSNMSQGYMVVPAFEFYTRFILAAPGGGLSWPQSFAAFLVWVIVFLALFCGVKVLGKVMWVTAGTSLVLLIVMFLRGVTLPCAWGGIRHLVQFDGHSLLDYNTWGFASANILYTYFFGFGIYTTLGSFSHFRHSFLRDVLAVSAASFAMEILSAMAVWSVLGYLMCAMGIPMEEATSTGAYLIYGTLPQALCKTSQPMLWSALFFLMMFLLAISSFIVLVQVLVAIVSTGLRRWCRKRWLLVLAVCGPGFCISLVYCSEKGGEWLSLVDGFAAIVTPLVVCLLEVIIFVYIYGAGRLARDVEMLSNTFVSYYCYFTWIATVPLVLLLILASHLLMMIRSSMYFLAISTTLAIPIFSLFYVFRSVFCKMLQGAATPWGPKAPRDRAAWERFCAERPVRRRFFHRRF